MPNKIQVAPTELVPVSYNGCYRKVVPTELESFLSAGILQQSNITGTTNSDPYEQQPVKTPGKLLFEKCP